MFWTQGNITLLVLVCNQITWYCDPAEPCNIHPQSTFHLHQYQLSENFNEAKSLLIKIPETSDKLFEFDQFPRKFLFFKTKYLESFLQSLSCSHLLSPLEHENIVCCHHWCLQWLTEPVSPSICLLSTNLPYKGETETSELSPPPALASLMLWCLWMERMWLESIF